MDDGRGDRSQSGVKHPQCIQWPDPVPGCVSPCRGGVPGGQPSSQHGRAVATARVGRVPEQTPRAKTQPLLGEQPHTHSREVHGEGSASLIRVTDCWRLLVRWGGCCRCCVGARTRVGGRTMAPLLAPLLGHIWALLRAHLGAAQGRFCSIMREARGGCREVAGPSSHRGQGPGS